MQGKVYEIPLDISSGVLTSQIRELVTEDMGTNTFRFKVVSDNHKPYDFTGTIVRMMVKTPSGARIQQECTIENAVGGTVSLTLKQSLLLEHGSYIAELQIFDAITQSIRLTTPTFTYHVRQSLQNSESIVATDEYTILQEALADLAGINIVVANKADKSDVGDLEDLATDEKANLVSAINEVKSQSNEIATELTNHKTEVTSVIKTTSRDVSLTGEQIVPLISGRTAEKITILAMVIGSSKFSNGVATTAGQSCIAQDAISVMRMTSKTIYISDSASSYSLGGVTINDGNISIDWTKVGTPTGTAQLTIMADYHA